jgi:hypothetical protein
MNCHRSDKFGSSYVSTNAITLRDTSALVLKIGKQLLANVSTYLFKDFLPKQKNKNKNKKAKKKYFYH